MSAACEAGPCLTRIFRARNGIKLMGEMRGSQLAVVQSDAKRYELASTVVSIDPVCRSEWAVAGEDLEKGDLVELIGLQWWRVEV